MTLLDQYRGPGPLRDVTVLDFTEMVMGPLATQLFGGLAPWSSRWNGRSWASGSGPISTPGAKARR